MLMSQTVELQTTSASKHISGNINRDPVAHSLALVTTSQHLPFGWAKFSSLSKRTETVGGFWTWATSRVWPSSLPVHSSVQTLGPISVKKQWNRWCKHTADRDVEETHFSSLFFLKSRQHLDFHAKGLTSKTPLNSKVALRYKGPPKLCQEMQASLQNRFLATQCHPNKGPRYRFYTIPKRILTTNPGTSKN